MNIKEILIDYWHWNIPAMLIIALLIIFHIISNGYRLKWKSINFFIGIVLFFFITFSPLDFLGHYYLFSAHMVQHIILLLIIPPLLITGTDKKFLLKLFSRQKTRKFGSVLFYPVVAWLFGVLSMWIWHAPLLFRAMMHSTTVHVVEIISLLIFGIIFAWPIFTPLSLRKLNPLSGSLYLFSACIGCTILGILITFAPEGYYSVYMSGSNPAIINFLQTDMGISPAADQQAAGLIMWVPACLVYLTIIMILMARWYKVRDEESDLEQDKLHLP